jgi:hypothetical protein
LAIVLNLGSGGHGAPWIESGIVDSELPAGCITGTDYAISDRGSRIQNPERHDKLTGSALRRLDVQTVVLEIQDP